MYSDLSHLPLPERLAHWLDQLAHVLPAQAPIRNFVHHNTLHGFQHLPFVEALAAAHELTGAEPYWTSARFQAEFAAGRIRREDLLAALQEGGPEGLEEEVVAGISRQAVLLACLLQREDLPVAATLRWQAQEGRQEDAAASFLALSQQLTAKLTTTETPESLHWPEVARQRCRELFARFGQTLTRRDLLLCLAGEDLLRPLQASLRQHLAAHLDLGVAAWANPAQAQGFYAAWRASVALDPGWDIDDLPNVRQAVAELPATALATLQVELSGSLPQEDCWPAYLQKLALQLPGWSGMVHWRAQHAVVEAGEVASAPVALVDYLAVAAVLERLLCADQIQQMTGAALSIGKLQDYFLAHPAEFYVRQARARGDLPEALQHRAAHLLRQAEGEGGTAADWSSLAVDLALLAERENSDQAARLASLLPHLPLSAAQLASWTPAEAQTVLREASQLSSLARRHLWLLAYEHHYRQQIFAALQANQQRARPLSKPALSAQVVMCMDDREEGTRRHLEEIAPSVATYGAAGFFGVAMYWQGLDDAARTALCPVVVQPAHVVNEVAQAADFAAAVNHAGRRETRLRWRERLYQMTRRDVVRGPLLTAMAGVPALLALTFNSLAPAAFGATLRRWRQQFEGRLATRLELTVEDEQPATAEQPRRGFTTAEQVDRVEAFLRTIGLTQDFAPLVLLLGHGSGSQNNPHLSAYDCGACSGRHGGPNARVFAAMANRPEVRAALVERGLTIPASCWFVAAEHNTCDDSIDWYDLAQVPAAWQGALDALLGQLAAACRAHAQERCRRLASAPPGLSPGQAEQHVRGRRYDLAQARPELGHATNACALVGRRALSQGLFLDRRAFLVSYDPAADAAGQILEQLLLAVGPVGAGISLEYYFSTVDNVRFGCGSKITHNLTGLFGVMEGADSDLRTGLPWQMVEIHEPMRLLLVVEQTTAVLTRLLNEQPALRELIDKAWIILAAQDPSTAAIAYYSPRRGWQPWSGESVLPQVARSADWFVGARGPLAPALLLGGWA